MRLCFAITLTGALPLLLSCAAPGGTGEPRRPDGQAPAFQGIASTVPAVGGGARAEAERLSLAEVISIAFARNPTFEVFEANRDAALAEVLSALAYPNPEIEATLGTARSREEPIESRREFGLSLTQPIESPFKRRARRRAAEAQERVVGREIDIFRETLRAEVTQAYATLQYHIQSQELGRQSIGLAREIRGIVERRVEQGEAPEIDLVKARIEVLKAERALSARGRQRQSAEAILTALCGGGLPPGFAPSDALSDTHPEITIEPILKDALERHPKLQKVDAELARAQAQLEREKTARHPDLKLGISGGEEFDTNKIGVSVGTEIPLWNRNQGGIAGAEAELRRIAAERDSMRIEIRRGVETASAAYSGAREQWTAFGGGLREAAAEALKIETFLYEQGESDFLQWLDARRTAQETEAEYLQALYDLNITRAELDRAAGVGGDRP